MDIDLQPGRYVLAVSGGVDSMVLLNLLATRPDVRLTVAHFDHGIRDDSRDDRRLVQDVASTYGLPFIYDAGHLGRNASEAVARQARYDFLHRVRRVSGAKAIVTAHHQDDVLETVILNLLRGTGSRGLASLKSTDVIQRPLLHVPKDELLRYAEREGIHWREDSTNSDDRYARNYVRLHIMPRFAKVDRDALLRHVVRAGTLNAAIQQSVINYLHTQPAQGELDRKTFGQLPHEVAREVMAEWLLQNAQVELSKKLLERLVLAAKTGRNGTKVDINKGYILEISRMRLALKPPER